MRWELWKPWYEKIVGRLGIDPEADRSAARLSNKLLPKPDIERFTDMFGGRECVVLGAGPSLDADLEKLERAGYLGKVLIAADGATSAVIGYRTPEVVVTDMDGDLADQLEAWRRGAWLVVHAHGDNLAALRAILPKLDGRVLGTTQVEPRGKLYNFGGFTDGDRAAFMVHELGARKIYLVGMDLGSEIGKHSGDKDVGRKLVKLEICKELLSWLAGELGGPLVNLTSAGEEIPNVPRLNLT